MSENKNSTENIDKIVFLEVLYRTKRDGNMFLEVYFIGINKDNNKNKSTGDKKEYRIILKLRSLPEKQKNSKDITAFFSSFDNILKKEDFDKKGKKYILYLLNINNSLFNNLSDNNNNFLDNLLKTSLWPEFNYNMWDYLRNDRVINDYTYNNISFKSIPKYDTTKFNWYKYDPNKDSITFKNKLDDDFQILKNYKSKKEEDFNPNTIVGDVSKVRVNNIEMLIILLFDIIFSHKDFKLKIKKCENCNKYFITNHNGNKYCDRNFKDNLSCKEYKKKIQVKSHYNTDIKKLEKRCKDLYNKNKSKYTNSNISFIEYRINLNNKLNNNTKLYVKNLLDIFYMTDKRKLEVIKKLELEKYLSKKYIDSLDNTTD